MALLSFFEVVFGYLWLFAVSFIENFLTLNKLSALLKMVRFSAFYVFEKKTLWDCGIKITRSTQTYGVSMERKYPTLSVLRNKAVLERTFMWNKYDVRQVNGGYAGKCRAKDEGDHGSIWAGLWFNVHPRQQKMSLVKNNWPKNQEISSMGVACNC